MIIEAPEKIYLDKNNKTLLDILSVRDTERIEYICKDIFIDKALKFLDENFYFNNLHYSIESDIFDSMEEMFEEFKKYVEGE